MAFAYPHDCMYSVTDPETRRVIEIGSYPQTEEARKLADLVRTFSGGALIQTWGPGTLPPVYRFDPRKSLDEMAREAQTLQSAHIAELVAELLQNAGAGVGELLQSDSVVIAPAQRAALVELLDAIRQGRDDCRALAQVAGFPRPHSIEPPAIQPRVENGTLAGRDPQLAAALNAEMERVRETQRGHVLGPVATGGVDNVLLDAAYALRRGDSTEMLSYLERLRKMP